MGCVVACVTVGPVAVDLGVAVGARADVARAVTAEVVLGDSVGNSPEYPFQPDCSLPTCPAEYPPPTPTLPREPGLLGTLDPLERGVCLSPGDARPCSATLVAELQRHFQ